MDEQLSPTTVDLREYLAILRARRTIVLATLAFVIAVAAAFTYTRTPIFESTARVLVKALPTSPSNVYFAPPPNLDTEAELIGSERVASEVVEDLGGGVSINEALDSLDVEPLFETEVLKVTFSSSSPEIARDGANLFAEHYISTRLETARSALEVVRSGIQERATHARTRLLRLTAAIRRAERKGDDALASSLEVERQVLIARIGNLVQRLTDLSPDRSLTLGAGEVIEPARLPGSPASPNKILIAILALVLGTAGGVAAAFIRDRLDDRFRGRMDLVKVARAPVLATIPAYPKGRKRSTEGIVDVSELGQRTLVIQSDPQGAASEAYRTLRTAVEFLAEEHGYKSFVVTSPLPEEGKTATTANLGAAIAQTGRRVILISADLRRPTLEGYFGVPREPGLSGRLLDPLTLMYTYIKETPIANLQVMPSGAIPHNPAELLTTPRLNQVIDQLVERFDMVIFDSPPVLPVADAAIIASKADATILVVDGAKTRRSAVEHAREALDKVSANVIGVVLNAYDLSSFPHYYDYSSARYYRQYGGYAEGNGKKSSDEKDAARLATPE